MNRKILITSLLTGLIIAGIFALYQFVWIGPNQLAGNDSYAHLAKSELFMQNGFDAASYKNMLPFTSWGKLGADNTLVYDLTIAPVTMFPNDIASAKIFTCLLAGLVAAVFYLISVSITKKNKFSAVAAVLMFANYAFFLKFTELRSLVFAILFFFLASALLFSYRKKYYLLAILAFLYTLLHTTAFFMLIPAGIMLLCDLKSWKKYLLPFVYVVTGMVAAIAIFPGANFLQIFFLQPIIPVYYFIAPFTIEGAVEVKGEIRTPWNFLIVNTINTLLFFVAVAALWNKKIRSKFDKYQLASILQFMLFMSLTLISRRFSDYIAPSALLMISLNSELILNYFNKLKTVWNKQAKLRIAAITAVIILVPAFLLIFYLRFIRDNLDKPDLGRTLPDSVAAAQFVAKNIPEGSYLYDYDWTDFPFLFYYARNYKYAAGMELGFMYLYDANMLRFYQDFRSDRNLALLNNKLIYTYSNQDALALIQDKFKSQYLLMRKGKTEKTTQLLLDNQSELGLQKLFEDKNYVIFKS